MLVFLSIALSKLSRLVANKAVLDSIGKQIMAVHCGDARMDELHHKPRHGQTVNCPMHVQLLKNREEVFQSKGGTGTKERKRSKYKSDEVESMDKVQLLGEAFQKIQIATGIHV